MKCRVCDEDGTCIHKQHIRNPKTRMLHVSERTSTCAHQLNPEYSICPFYELYSNNVSLQHAKESYFINLMLKRKLNKTT